MFSKKYESKWFGKGKFYTSDIFEVKHHTGIIKWLAKAS